MTGFLKSGKYQSYFNVVGIDADTVKYFDLPELVSGEMMSNDNLTGVLLSKNAINFYNPNSNRSGGMIGNNDEEVVDLLNDNIKMTFDSIWDDTKVPKFSKLNVVGVLRRVKL